MPAGSRRSALSEKVELVIDRYAESGMVLPFAHSTAPHFARIVAMRAELKQPISVPDAMIAAICAEHQASCATRNVRDFSGTGIAFINPWESNASGV